MDKAFKNTLDIFSELTEKSSFELLVDIGLILLLSLLWTYICIYEKSPSEVLARLSCCVLKDTVTNLEKNINLLCK